MLKKFLLVLALLCLPVSLFAGNPVLLDTRLLLLAHPLFVDFDTDMGRFRGTSSEFVEGGQKGLDKLVEEIQELNSWLSQAPQVLRDRIKNIPLPDRMAAERTFLVEKRDKEQRVAAMQMRAYQARLIPGRLGITPTSSIYPQINQIMADIRAVIQKTKERYNSELIIDACDLLPVADSSALRSELLVQNLHAKLWKGQPVAKNMLEWLAEADNFWAGQLGMNAQIFPFGVTDARLEAIKMLEERTKGQRK